MPSKMNHYQQQPKPASPFASLRGLLPYGLAILLGVGVVALTALALPRFMRCAPLGDITSIVTQTVIVAVAALVPAVLSFFMSKIPRVKIPSKNIAIALTLGAAIFTFLVFRYGLPAPSETVCYPELKAIYGLISAEGQAVMDKDMAAIEKIYSPDAVIENVALDKRWGNPALYYGPKFAEEVHCSINHSHYDMVLLTASEASVTTASSGTWGKIASANGCPETYNNPAGSDHWTFVKIGGQWYISGFRFNCYAAPDKCKE